MSSTLSGIIQSLRTIAAVFIVVLTHTSLATASVLIQDLIPQGSYQPSQGLLLHHSLYRLCAQILLSPVMLSQSLIFPRNTKLCRIRQLCWITVTHWLPLEAGCTEIPQQHHLNCSRMSIKCVVMQFTAKWRMLRGKMNTSFPIAVWTTAVWDTSCRGVHVKTDEAPYMWHSFKHSTSYGMALSAQGVLPHRVINKCATPCMHNCLE